MRGIVSCGGYVPYRRLQRAEIAATFGKGGGKGTRAVASFDEDTTTMGFEAARIALGSSSAADTEPDALWFATADPAYLDKTNATAIHAALRLDRATPAFDAGTSVRSAAGLLRSALSGTGTTLVVTADRRTGLPTSAEESVSGDAAAAVLVGSDDVGPLLAECLGGWSATEEFLDRWRTPGASASRTWEERFGETRYVPLGEEAWNAALKGVDLTPADVDHLIVTGLHARATKGLARRLGVADEAVVDTLTGTVGNVGVAQPLFVLTDVLERAVPGRIIALVTLADGADVTLFRTTDALAAHQPARPVATQVAAAADLPYGRFLSWKEQVAVEPPNRPPPDRPSASAAARREDWKFGFVGSQDRQTEAVHLPPHRVSMKGGAIDDMDPVPLGDARGTIVTFTVDRLVFSPSPPVVFAVIDFDGGGRTACELTDVDPDEVEIGGRVEMTFRRLFTSPDGIHNYFWKARPVRDFTAPDQTTRDDTEASDG